MMSHLFAHCHPLPARTTDQRNLRLVGLFKPNPAITKHTTVYSTQREKERECGVVAVGNCSKPNTRNRMSLILSFFYYISMSDGCGKSLTSHPVVSIFSFLFPPPFLLFFSLMNSQNSLFLKIQSP